MFQNQSNRGSLILLAGFLLVGLLAIGGGTVSVTPGGKIPPRTEIRVFPGTRVTSVVSFYQSEKPDFFKCGSDISQLQAYTLQTCLTYTRHKKRLSSPHVRITPYTPRSKAEFFLHSLPLQG
ncbi:MAG: hypothetical protein KF803_04570 [Cyclobacteriaceae bacterium]|nr:hypothetical protein [Cyclobacteriaceae bacterium]